MDLTQTQQDDRVAQTVIGGALGVHVRVHDDGSQNNMHDLAFEYPNGTTVAAEVVSNRQPALQRTWNQAKMVGFQPDVRLSRTWTVTVHHGTNAMQLKRRLSTFLTDLEARGVAEVDELDLYDIYEDPDSEWAEIASARSRPSTGGMGPGFSISMTAWTGWLGDGDDALAYVEEQFDSAWADVTQKLINAGSDEGHAVILLVHDVIGPMWAIEEGETPTRKPVLPDGIDGLWIIARGQFPLRAVYALPGQSWRDVEVTADDYLAVCNAA